MKKVFDQTVRDLKREVNKKVLKVPGIEQKVLDATSNEPWGPHGSLLSDIAVATRNYHEYQMIMTVIWKRINDTGKNWRHVYKALLVLEYLVANGSERVIDEIKEHAYQISALSEFQYIDSSGRDQGNNVRRKSQSLVALVSDKERIIEVRQKAAANREKFRNTPSGGMYRPGTGGYGDRYDEECSEGRFGSREEDRNGYGREREWGNKDDDRYGRDSDPYNRDGDRYGKEYEERYGRDGFREDEFRGRSKSVDDDYPYGSRSRSSDRDRDRSFNDDGQHSSRGSGARAEEHSQDGRKIERKFSEQNIGAPPSYEEVVSESRSPAYNEREEEASTASAPRAASPSANNQLAPSPPTNNNPPSFPSPSHHPSQANNVHGFTASPAKHEVGAADEFDPRGPVPVIPVTNNTEMNLLGSLSHALAVVPTTSATTTYEVESHVNSGSVPSSSNISQPFEDPFGEGLFKAAPSADAPQVQSKTFASSDSFPASMDHIAEPPNGGAQKADMGSSFDFGDSLSGITYSTVQTPTNSQSLPQELSATHQNTDILADILPPSQPGFSALGAQPGQSGGDSFGTYEVQPGAIVPVNMTPQMQSVPASQQGGGNYLHGGSTMPATSYMVPQITSGSTAYFNSGSFIQQGGFRAPQNGNFYSQQGVFTAPNHGNYYSQVGNQSNQGMMGPTSQFNGGNLLPQQGSAAGVSLQVAHQAPTGPASQHNNMMLGNLASQTGSSTSMAPQQAKDKFEPKSAVWADTLSRGLVNLNISGPKTNPLSDIGVDFDALNRKEKRMEKQPAQTSVASTVTMGKAMGSGSGLGRASAGAVRPKASAMMGSGIGMGMGMGGGSGVGGYGGMSQTMGGMGINPGMGMNIGMRQGVPMPGMGMNIGMRQGVPMQIPSGLPPGSNMSGYNPMMGPGGNGQQPYGGYR